LAGGAGVTALEPVTRPVLRWHGGKWRVAPWILAHLPRHVCYVEPFGGAASVLLRKPPSRIEVLNDGDQRLVRFFRTLREREAELIRAIDLTPYSRAEFEAAFELADDPVEDARRVYVLCWQGRSRGLGEWRTGWRYEITGHRVSGAVDDFRSDHLPAVVQRLKHVQLECDHADAVIARYDAPTTLYYLDPPYVWETRSKRTSKVSARYMVELDEAGHRALAEQLHQVAGMVVLSGYPSPLYAELYEAAGWRRLDRTCLTDHGFRTECLWLNPAAAAALPRQEGLW
jgi:DNA adenine methylase